MFSQRELLYMPAHRTIETLNPCAGAQVQPLRGVSISPTASKHKKPPNPRGLLCIVRDNGHGVHRIDDGESTTPGTHAIQPSEGKRIGRCKAAALNCARCPNWTSTSAAREFLAWREASTNRQIRSLHAQLRTETARGTHHTGGQDAHPTYPHISCPWAHLTHNGSQQKLLWHRTPPPRSAANVRTLQPRRPQSCTSTERGGQNPIGLNRTGARGAHRQSRSRQSPPSQSRVGGQACESERGGQKRMPQRGWGTWSLGDDRAPWMNVESVSGTCPPGAASSMAPLSELPGSLPGWDIPGRLVPGTVPAQHPHVRPGP